jgi:hypothetical protein
VIFVHSGFVTSRHARLIKASVQSQLTLIGWYVPLFS